MREKLPTDRAGLTTKVKINGHKLYSTFSCYPDGRPGEVFTHMDCGGSTVNGLLGTVAILLSICLQHGLSMEYLLEKLKDTKFEPSGTTTNAEIPMCSSIPDFIVRWIGLELKKRKQAGEAGMEQS